MSKPPNVTDEVGAMWILAIAANLAAAGALCAAFESGRDYQRDVERASTLAEVRAARRDGWHPGCGRNASP
jgi:hypothetical protein